MAKVAFAGCVRFRQVSNQVMGASHESVRRVRNAVARTILNKQAKFLDELASRRTKLLLTNVMYDETKLPVAARTSRESRKLLFKKRPVLASHAQITWVDEESRLHDEDVYIKVMPLYRFYA
eukprot:4972591-Amphidinium_carterae.1